MTTIRHPRIIVFAVMVSLIVATGIVFAQGPTNNETLFTDDFSGNEIGTEPSGWAISEATRQISTIEVVEDSDLASGHAVYFAAQVTDPARTASLNANLAGPDAAEANTIAIDFAVKWVEGGAINIYVTKENTHRVNLFINEGMLGYRYAEADGERTRDFQVGALHPGWNQVRVVADRQTSQATIYLNDMDNPAMNAQRFRTSVDSWDGSRFIISHTTLSPGTAYYGDVDISALD